MYRFVQKRTFQSQRITTGKNEKVDSCILAIKFIEKKQLVQKFHLYFKNYDFS